MNSEKINDGRSEVEIDISDDEFLKLAKMAHERDITFNKMVEYILEQEIARINAEKAITNE